MSNTRYLMDFGRRELHMAAILLRLFRTQKDLTLRLGDKVTPEFNTDSGLVFLTDENFNVAMEKGGYLFDWLRCPNCGSEGFKETLEEGAPCCKLYAQIELG